MSPHRSRFVTACQQLLALGLVLAVLTPAAGVVTLDVVGSAPGSASLPAAAGARLSAYVAEAVRPSVVPTAPVRPHVREVQLTATTAPVGRSAAATSSDARLATTPRGESTVISTPQPVTGFGEVGVTWAHGDSIPEQDLSVTVRTRTDGVWSDWQDVPYDPEHGPDPGSAEARHARPGTDPVLVGKVDDVQVRATTSSPLPADMQLAVIAPGHAARSTSERAAYDTSSMDGGNGADSVYAAQAAQQAAGPAETTSDGTDTATLAAAVFTPQPVIYSRAQWGADERLREKASLHYGDVHAGFVHHTVNANDYTRAEVPGIIRSIYAYHVKSRGWSDIGYNFLVDRFGRIWEGRYGGVDRPVVGAHTQGFNDDSFAASAIGNYQIARPTQAMIQAYATLFAWKLSLHGVDADSTHQWVTSRWFQAINGHRDAAATLCPGQYLYNRLPDIRRLAAAAQRGWTGRELESNLASTPHPDLVVRRASDGEAFVIPTGGLMRFPRAVTAATGVTGTTGALVTPDLTGDDRSDLLVHRADGSLALRPGTAAGGFGSATRVFTWSRGRDLVAAPGDLNGDGRNDLVARNPATGSALAFLQRADGSFKRVALGSWQSYDLVTGAGDLNRDGHPDLVARDGSGALWLLAGTGKGGFAAPVQVGSGFGRYDVVAGGGDLTHDGRPDLLVRVGSTGDAYVLPGNGDGTFAPGLGPFKAFAGASQPVIGNVAGSAQADVVALSGDDVEVWVNPGYFDLGAPIDTGVAFPATNRILAVGDWDRDGYGDVITRTTSGDLVLWRGNGRGKLTRFGVVATGFGSVGRLAAVGDMTGDGYPDLVGQPARGVLMLYPGAGTAGLKKAYPAYGAVKAPSAIGVGRWDADGAPDTLVRQGGTLTLLHGNGPGWMQKPQRLSTDVSAYDWVIGVSSLRGAGHPDLLVRQPSTGRLYALLGSDSGLGAPIYLGNGLGIYDLAG